jgi:hypothetical protein
MTSILDGIIICSCLKCRRCVMTIPDMQGTWLLDPSMEIRAALQNAHGRSLAFADLSHEKRAFLNGRRHPCYPVH